MSNTVIQSVKRIITGLLAVMVLLLPALPRAWSADTATTDATQGGTASQQDLPNVPDKGMSMHRVEQRFGKPLKVLAARGKPPITRWVYKDFTVYFEGRYVIHAVKNYLGEPPDERPPATGQ